jgi:metallo-beta-lactamase class B
LKVIATCSLLGIFLICQNLGAADSSTVELRQISQHVWTHTSYEIINGYWTDSNGLIIECSTGLILVDTCWNDPQTQVLLKEPKALFHKSIILAIITHAHSDRIGGIRTLLANGIKVVSTSLTSKMAVAAGYPKPLPELDSKSTILNIANVEIEAYYPGAGHTQDNIVVWIPIDQVLYGGCLIKSMQSTNLGNTADADIRQWGPSIQNVKNRYSQAKLVVPGHGAVGGIELLQHTFELCLRK